MSEIHSGIYKGYVIKTWQANYLIRENIFVSFINSSISIYI